MLEKRINKVVIYEEIQDYATYNSLQNLKRAVEHLDAEVKLIKEAMDGICIHIMNLQKRVITNEHSKTEGSLDNG